MPHFGVFEGWVGRIESVISISEQEYAISFVKHQNRGRKVKTWYDRVCHFRFKKRRCLKLSVSADYKGIWPYFLCEKQKPKGENYYFSKYSTRPRSQTQDIPLPQQ